MDKQTIQAIKDSIEHWEEDILKPLRDGMKIHPFDYDTLSCPLCSKFYDYLSCKKCPLTIIDKNCNYGKNNPWLDFRKANIDGVKEEQVKTAEAMINTLKSLLEGDKK